MSDETPTTDTPPADTASSTEDDRDAADVVTVEQLRAEVIEWRTRARALEREAKTARDEAAAVRAAVAAQFAHRLVDAEFRAAAVDRDRDVVEAVREAVDRSKFVDADGNVDTDRIVRTLDAVAPRRATPTTPAPPAPRRIDLSGMRPTGTADPAA